MDGKKIHFVVNGNSKTGICGLKHANFITTDPMIFFKHSLKCDKCEKVLNRLYSQNPSKSSVTGKTPE